MYKMRELQSLLRLPYHRNIVQLYEVHRSDIGTVSFVMEFMSHGTLLDLMEDHSNPSGCGSNNSPTSICKSQLSHHIVRHLVHQILLGVQHLHSHHMYHRDLKPENILLGPNYLCKIADFSLARAYDEIGIPTSYVSTRWYRAPEILLRTTEYASPVDIWAIGCIACELYTYEPLFPGRDECDQLHLIFTAFGTPQMANWKEGMLSLNTLNIQSWQNPANDFYESPQAFMVKILSSNNLFSINNVESSAIVEFLLSLLTLDPARRSDTNVALQHQYFSGIEITTSSAPHGVLPSTFVNDDKENCEIFNTPHPNNTNHVKNDISAIIATQIPDNGSNFNVVNDKNKSVASKFNNQSALHDQSANTRLPLLHKQNPYKKGRIR